MRAMVLAAGEGRRLRPWTEETPKALIEVGGVPMIERVIRRLVAAGVDAVMVNTFHLADALERFLASRDLGAPISISRETILLDTGGGLKKAAWFFKDGRPFLLHNVDVITDVDLGALIRRHEESGALATLAARARPGKRRLLFDADGLLRGREVDGKAEWVGPTAAEPVALAFDGIHVISPAIFDRMTEEGVFSITNVYLRLAAAGEPIRAFRTDGTLWAEIGNADRLAEARRLAQAGQLPAV